MAIDVGEPGNATAALEAQTAALDAKISVQPHTGADFDRRLSQIDSAIEEATKRGKTKTGVAIMEAQRETRSSLVDERKREAGLLPPCRQNASRWSLKGTERQQKRRPSGTWPSC